jgi:hypothetical protein
LKQIIFFSVLLWTPLYGASEVVVATMNVENLGEGEKASSSKALRVKEERISRIVGVLLKDLTIFQEVHDKESLERIVQKRDPEGRLLLLCTSSKLQKTCTVGEKSFFRAVDEIAVEIVEGDGSRKSLRPFLRSRWRIRDAGGDVVLFAVHLPAAYHSLAMRQEAMIQLTQPSKPGR